MGYSRMLPKWSIAALIGLQSVGVTKKKKKKNLGKGKKLASDVMRLGNIDNVCNLTRVKNLESSSKAPVFPLYNS